MRREWFRMRTRSALRTGVASDAVDTRRVWPRDERPTPPEVERRGSSATTAFGGRASPVRGGTALSAGSAILLLSHQSAQ